MKLKKKKKSHERLYIAIPLSYTSSQVAITKIWSIYTKTEKCTKDGKKIGKVHFFNVESAMIPFVPNVQIWHLTLFN